ncbi:MAG: hypothetical protein WCG25_03390 [bacterium]
MKEFILLSILALSKDNFQTPAWIFHVLSNLNSIFHFLISSMV